MTPLSTRTKESIKTALAMVVAYAIALSMGWDKPLWAAFTVAFVSLDTAGASLNKAALRMFGTLLAGLVALAVIGLFPQDRWAMMLCLSLYLGCCVYKMTSGRHAYFWFVSAFVVLVIIVDSAPTDSLTAFQITMARVQETGMGVLVYSLISAFLWPRSSQQDLLTASRNLAGTQQELFQSYWSLMHGRDVQGELRPIALREVQLATQVGQALAAATSDSYAVWELRRQWAEYHRLSIGAMEALERWRETFPQVRDVDLTKPLPNLEEVCTELDRRFSVVADLLAGQSPEARSEKAELQIDLSEVRDLRHFEKAAVAVAKAQLDRLEALSRSLLDVVLDIRGYRSETTAAPKKTEGKFELRVDVDRLRAAVWVVATHWVGFLIWIYFDPPGHGLFVFMATQWALAASLVGLSVIVLVPGFVAGIVLGGVIYVLVMPQLSGYLQLGAMIFVVTFAIFYIFWPPKLRLMRASLLALFNVLMFLDNHQTYDFATYANTAAAVLLSLALTVGTAFVLTVPRPEKAFLILFRRFCRQADFMLSHLALDRDSGAGWGRRWKTAIYGNDLLALPDKMARLVPQIDYSVLPADSPEKVGEMVVNMKAIAYRIKELLEARELPHSEVLVTQFQDELRGWREVAQEQIRLWADDPERSLAPGVDLQGRLSARMERVDARIEETYRKDDASGLEERDYENFFRYLGGLRGLSEAGLGFIAVARTLDWRRWREARF